MMNPFAIFLITASLFHCTLQELTFQECESNERSDNTVKLSMISKKGKTGEWRDTFSAVADYSSSADNMKLYVTHRAVECNGRRIVYIQGVTGDNAVNYSSSPLLFHPRCGKNIAIVDNGRAVQKISLGDPINAAVFTNRPLKDDEMFEVRLDKRNSKSGHSLGIGIILNPPSQVNILPEMWKSSEAWIWHHTSVHTNARAIVTNYGTTLDGVQVGDRVGVMRSSFGTLNFFINGVDQGPAASDIPSPVYGLVELWHNAAKVTIM